MGLLGGVASGKSFVANEMRRLGAVVVDADRIGHEVLEDEEVKQLIRNRWGEGVLYADGRVDRKALASRVFRRTQSGKAALAELEEITHPRISCKLIEKLNHYTELGNLDVLVFDAAVMLKTGWDKNCDEIVFVECPSDIRLQRAMSRGWSRNDFADREAAQESLEKKRNRADVIIDNSGTCDETREQIRSWWTSRVG